MKKVLIAFTLLSFVFLVASCGKDPNTETPFIDVNTSPEMDIENPYWDWADKYPGPVDDNTPIVNDVAVTVKGGYDDIPYVYGVPVLQGTHLYAPQLKIVTFEVPAGVSDLHYQIGMGYPLLDDQVRRRYTDVVSKGELPAGQTTSVMSYFGGYIYLYYPEGSVPAAGNDITVKISGAVESYDYVDGETDMATWVSEMKRRSFAIRGNVGSDGVTADPTNFLWWTELYGEKVILTFGASEMYLLDYPNTLLANYERLVDVFCDFGGIEWSANQTPLRIYNDIQLPASGTEDRYRYGGYPAALRRGENQRDDSGVNQDQRYAVSVYLTQLEEDPRYTDFFYNALAYTFVETFGGEWLKRSEINESWRNLANYYFLRHELNPNRARYPSITDEGAIPRGAPTIDYVNSSTTALLNLSQVKSNFFTKTQFITMFHCARDNKPEGVVSDPVQYRATIYWWLAVKYGWGLISYVNEQAHKEKFVNEWDQDSYDFFAMCACEYADADLRPYFDMWYYTYTQHAGDYMSKFPTIAEDGKWWLTPLTASDEPSYEPYETPPVERGRPGKSYVKWRTPVLRKGQDADPSTYWNLEYYKIDSLFFGDTVKYRDPAGTSHVDEETGAVIIDSVNVMYNANCFVTGPGFTNFDAQRYADNERPIITSSGYPAPDWNNTYRVLHVYCNFTEPVTFNVMNWKSNHNTITTSMLYAMEYWDMASQTWKTMRTPYGDHFRMVWLNNKEVNYFFAETYTTNRFRFKGLPRDGACRVQDLKIGYTDPSNPPYDGSTF